LGLLFSLISRPGNPTLLMFTILLSSTTTSTGPIGGAPLPLISVAPLIINCSKGPSPLKRSGASAIWLIEKL
ncbi:MAG: hypothetical protein HOD79_02955, partial [Flavobacteriaceae bacterium]|nr:hypothetical protein [Flavobacteriaceae bacterium]